MIYLLCIKCIPNKSDRCGQRYYSSLLQDAIGFFVYVCNYILVQNEGC